MQTRFLISLFVLRERGLLQKLGSQNLAKFEAVWCRNLPLPFSQHAFLSVKRSIDHKT